MIIDNIQNYARYQEIPHIGCALKEIAEIYQSGIYPENDQELSNEIKINRVVFRGKQERVPNIFENHHQWVDIHFIFEGSEKILVTPAKELKRMENYNADNDIEFFEGTGKIELVLNPGAFLVCYPEEAHCVGGLGNPSSSSQIKKLVGKIKGSDKKRKL